MSRLLSQSVRTNVYLIRGGGGLRQSSTLGKGRYPVVWNHPVGASMNHNNTVMRGVRLYHHANNNKNYRVLLASLQNEERKAAEGLLEWIYKQVKVPKGMYILFRRIVLITLL